MNLSYWLRRPQLILPRLQYWAWERMNPGKPWLPPRAVAYCAGVLTKTMRALEFGSGRSTAWFARRVGHLTSVEHSAAWFDLVRADLDQHGIGNVDYRLVPLDHPESEPEREHYERWPRYVDVLETIPNDSLDLVVVDGQYRTTCIRACSPKLRPGGLLLVDDINWWGGADHVPVPTGWPRVHLSGNGLKATGVWQKPGGGSRSVA